MIYLQFLTKLLLLELLNFLFLDPILIMLVIDVVRCSDVSKKQMMVVSR